jgi:hypothetical protein
MASQVAKTNSDGVFTIKLNPVRDLLGYTKNFTLTELKYFVEENTFEITVSVSKTESSSEGTEIEHEILYCDVHSSDGGGKNCGSELTEDTPKELTLEVYHRNRLHHPDASTSLLFVDTHSFDVMGQVGFAGKLLDGNAFDGESKDTSQLGDLRATGAVWVCARVSVIGSSVEDEFNCGPDLEASSVCSCVKSEPHNDDPGRFVLSLTVGLVYKLFAVRAQRSERERAKQA